MSGDSEKENVRKLDTETTTSFAHNKCKSHKKLLFHIPVSLPKKPS